MKLVTKIAMFMALTATIVSCKKDLIGEGPVSTTTRPVGNFSSIDLQMNGNVYYQPASDFKVEVSAKQSIHGQLETVVENSRLIVRYRNGKTYDADESIRINVYGPGVNSFMLNTSGSIFVIGDIVSNQVYARSSGSGDITFKQIQADHMEAESKQSGRISATGGAISSEKLKTDGSGKIDFGAIDAKDVNARIIGSGDIRVSVSDHLGARIDGSGSVFFRGTPILSTDINGSGRIIRF